MKLKTLCGVSDFIAHWQKGWVKLGKRLAQLQVGTWKLASFLDLTPGFFAKKGAFHLIFQLQKNKTGDECYLEVRNLDA